MIKSGITFVRVVKTPGVDFLDFTSQLEGRDSFEDVMTAIQNDHYFKRELSPDILAHIIENTLNILKAEFSAVDPKNVIPMWDDQTPQEVMASAICGATHNIDEPISHKLELVEPEKNYQVCPRILSLPDLLDGVKVADDKGHFKGITSEQLSKAIRLLMSEQNLLYLNYKKFHHFSAPASMILSGEQIRRSFIETRSDNLLNTLFDKSTQPYRRFAPLPQRTLG